MERHRSFRLSSTPNAVLSSSWTAYFKRWLPVILVGVPAATLLAHLWRIVSAGRVTATDIAALGVAGLMLPMGFVFVRRVAFPLIDEVIDEGECLVVRIAGREDRVPLGNIAAVVDGPTVRPALVVLRLEQPCCFGREITFMPRYRFTWNLMHPLVDELRARVKAVRNE